MKIITRFRLKSSLPIGSHCFFCIFTLVSRSQLAGAINATVDPKLHISPASGERVYPRVHERPTITHDLAPLGRRVMFTPLELEYERVICTWMQFHLHT